MESARGALVHLPDELVEPSGETEAAEHVVQEASFQRIERLSEVKKEDALLRPLPRIPVLHR